MINPYRKTSVITGAVKIEKKHSNSINRRSASACLLVLLVRITSGSWKFVPGACCVCQVELYVLG